MSGPDDDIKPEPPPVPSLGAAGEPCGGCAAPLAADQRYCLECGHRRGPARLDVLAEARRRTRVPRTLIHADVAAAAAVSPPAARRIPLPSPRIGAALCLAMLTGGIALGAAAGPQASATFAAGGRQIIAVVQPDAAPPATVAAAPATTTDTAAGDSAAATDDAATGVATVDAGAVPLDTAVPVPEATVPDTSGTDTGSGSGTTSTDTPDIAPASKLPPVKYVWVISLTGQRFKDVWGPKATQAEFKDLAAQGTLLSQSFAVAHGELPNGIALLSGQGPNPATQEGCSTPQPLTPGTLATSDKDPLQQAAGTGCIYPATVPSLPDQLTGAGLTWKAYVESIASPDPNGAQTCRHPDAGTLDGNTAPLPGDPYVTARNPFVYFASITGDPVCGSQVVGLDRLAPDLAAADQTPAFSYIVPNACHDGDATPCAAGAPAGLPAAGPWLKGVVDQITATQAYKDAGLIVVTTDQAPQDGPLADSRGCACDGTGNDPVFWPNTPDAGGIAHPGRGGGHVGTLLISPFVTPGRDVGVAYDQVSILKSIEDLFGLPHLGAASDKGHRAFGPKVYAKYVPASR